MSPRPLRIGIPARIQHLVEGQVQHYHAHHFLEQSLARLYPGQTSGRVMSVHHQAIKDLGEGLSVEARCATDGIIEAIRLEGAPYVVGLQWHPECHPGNPQLLDSTPILDDFLAAARSASEGSQ